MKKRTIIGLAIIGVFLFIWIIGLLMGQRVPESKPSKNDYIYTAVAGGYSIKAGENFIGNQEIFIPAEYDGKDVIAIDSNGFADSNLRVVYLPSTIKRIGDYAFANNSELVYMEIPASVTTIGKRIFNGSIYNSTYIRIEAKTIPSGWSFDWNRNTIDGEEVNAAYYSTGNFLTYEKTKARYVMYDALLFDDDRTEIGFVTAGELIKKVKEYQWPYVKITLESGTTGWVEFAVVSLGSRQGIYMDDDLTTSRLRMMPFPINESSPWLDTLGKTTDLNHNQYVKALAMLSGVYIDGDRSTNYNYVLIEYAAGDYAWMLAQSYNMEIIKAAFSFGPLRYALANIVARSGHTVGMFLLMISFFMSFSLSLFFLLPEIGNRIQKLQGDVLIWIALPLQLIVSIVVGTTVGDVYFARNADFGIGFILAILLMIFLELALLSMNYYMYKSSWCYHCNLWEGIELKSQVVETWEDKTITTTITTDQFGHREESVKEDTQYHGRRTHHCQCQNCGTSWTYDSVY
ncbi:MAG: leucine-rich repeat domain-containing protein [Bacilli bacterium]|jgi:hypothetical protein|nr:leucine-rich repeat domain-containing protein [Bacilli bacterium]MDY0209388.1 leucine-rich repeat domain-containing protein [Bacilli bacterium]